jgi:hypothetical protein
MTKVIAYLLTCLPTYLLTPCNRVLLEKLTGSQLVKQFLAFYGTRKFTTAFTRARLRLLLLRIQRIREDSKISSKLQFMWDTEKEKIKQERKLKAEKQEDEK